jgi:hypothetical protein
VLAKGQASRTAAGERQVLHFEKRNDVLIETGLVFELFDEIEKNVGRTSLQFLAHQIDIIVDGKMLRRVSELAERGHNVRLGLPVFGFQFLAEILIQFGGTCAVEEQEDFELLFHSFLMSVIPSVGSARVSRAGFGVAPKQTFSEMSLR